MVNHHLEPRDVTHPGWPSLPKSERHTERDDHHCCGEKETQSEKKTQRDNNLDASPMIELDH